MAAITPPLGPDGFFAAPARTESTGEVTPPLVDVVVLPEIGLEVSVVVVGVEIGDDDNNDIGGMVSDDPMAAGSVGLGTGPEEADVTADVETPAMVGVGVSPMLDAGIKAVAAGSPVVKKS